MNGNLQPRPAWRVGGKVRAGRIAGPVRQRGVALITSLLLLLVITIVAVSMFRSFGTQEKLAGNVREKERALHAAVTAQQYAEWWLTQPEGIAAANAATFNAAPACGGAGSTLDANTNQTQICSNALGPPGTGLGLDVTQVPWTIAGPGGGLVGVSYLPPGMCIALTGCTSGANTGGSGDPPYYSVPTFYIAYLGPSADNGGYAFQIDAFGYGGSPNAVAVVESTIELVTGTGCTSCAQ